MLRSSRIGLFKRAAGTIAAATALAYANSAAAQAAATDQASVTQEATTQRDSAASDHVLPSDEIIVTAQKFEQRIQDVPASVSFVSAKSLLESNRLSLRDFFTQIPGLSLQVGSFQTVSLSIRGISNQIAGLPTVSVLLDNASLVSQVAGYVIPEIDPDQITRIEVLKGPQGTLYGASTMGGLLKYVTKDPSTAGFSGAVQGGVSGIDHGSKLGYNLRGNANIPLTSTLAIRVGAFDRVDPGYIDNLLTNQDDTNSVHVMGGNVTALWRPSGDWSLRINGLYQRKRSDEATNDVDTLGSEYSVSHSRVKNSQRYRATTAAASAVLTGKIAGVTLTDIVSYSATNDIHGVDYSSAFGGLVQDLYGVAGAIVPGFSRVRNFSEELRANGSLLKIVDWTVGGYYTKQRLEGGDRILAADPLTGVVVADSDALLREYFHSRYSEVAIFAAATVKLTDRLSIEFGGREANVRVGDFGEVEGTLATSVTPRVTVKQSAFTFSASSSYKINSDSMIYARVASGFRAGGFNNTSLTSQLNGVTIDPSYGPDKTINYEVGLKGSLFDGRVRGDINAYYIDWQRIQLGVCSLIDGVYYCYTTNASGAKSAGVEAQMTAQLWKGATLQGWINYDDAVLTAGFPATATILGSTGDSLPYNAKYSGDVSLRQQFDLSDTVSVFGSLGINYVGSRKGKFTDTSVRQRYDPYTTLRLLAGITKGPWSTTMFVNNLTNAHGQITGGLDYFPPAGAYVFIPPRSFGLNVRREF